MSHLPSVDQRLIYHHIPKCGGSSLRETIRMALVCGGCDPNAIYVAGAGRANIMSERDYITVKPHIQEAVALLAHIDIRLLKKLKAGKVITCIRHPITRAISAFNHFTLMKEKACPDLVTIFKEDKSKFDRLFACLYSRPGGYGLKSCDYAYVLIYERLKEDVPKMLKALGLPVVPLPHVDPSPAVSRKHRSRFHYDESNPDHVEIWKYLEQRLAPDIEIYNKYLNLAENA